MDKILYEDNEFKLAYNELGMYILINNDEYILSCHPYEPCTYIQTKDKSINITMRNAFDLTFVVADFEKGKETETWRYKNVTPLKFCQIIKSEIFRDKATKKQEIVKETGYKTTNKD